MRDLNPHIAFNDENYKALKNEIEKDTREWKEFPILWVSIINIIKMAI